MLWMPLALGHSHGALRAPSSSNRVRPVNHSQAWGYGRPAQKELLGNKFSGTSEPVNTVSEFTVAFFFFFPSRKVFLGVKPSLRRVKKTSFFLEGLGKQTWTILNAELHDSSGNRMNCLGVHDPSVLHCGSAVS